MYAWIWRQLPFGRLGKTLSSLLLIGAAMAMLWFVVFPWLDPFIEQTLLPWNEGQLEGDFGSDGGATGDGGAGDDGDSGGELVGPDGQVLDDEHDLPYDTD